MVDQREVAAQFMQDSLEKEKSKPGQALQMWKGTTKDVRFLSQKVEKLLYLVVTKGEKEVLGKYQMYKDHEIAVVAASTPFKTPDKLRTLTLEESGRYRVAIFVSPGYHKTTDFSGIDMSEANDTIQDAVGRVDELKKDGKEFMTSTDWIKITDMWKFRET